MLIEYKIKFEKDGLTITQRVEPNNSGTQPVSANAVGAIAAASHLGASFAAGAGGDGGVDDTSLGGGGPQSGSGPVTILGPIIFGGSSSAPSPADPGKGGDGGVDDTSLGGGAPGAAAKSGGAGGKTS